MTGIQGPINIIRPISLHRKNM